MPEEAAAAQVDCLARLLAARGMTSLLLERQLESLGRMAREAPEAARGDGVPPGARGVGLGPLFTGRSAHRPKGQGAALGFRH